MTASPAARPKSSFWNDRGVRAVIAQVIAIVLVVAAGLYLVHNTLENLETRNIKTGFGFLSSPSGFAIGETLIDFKPADSYGRAILVGTLNTLMVSAIGIVLCTIVGLIAGLSRLSRNFLVARIATVYVEGLRNIPVLLQLFIWYGVITVALPGAKQAFVLGPSIFLSNRGLRFPYLVFDQTATAMAVAFVIGIIGSVLWTKSVRRHQTQTGELRPVLLPNLAMIFGLPVAAVLVSGGALTWELPELRGFNFAGGSTLSPELTALVVGLSLYTGTFVAEVVRSGILAVPKGQTEAGRALGLSPGTIMRLVILPQALRVIIPPVVNQYLNLAKNSTLAVLIGYPDLVQIVNTAINQTGQAIEGVAVMMAVYLTISLSVSGVLNWFNERVKLVER